MKQKNIIIGLIGGIVLLGGGFYGGIQYEVRNVQAKFASQQLGRGSFGGGANTVGQRQGGQRSMQGANGGAGDFIAGEIIFKDDTSATIKTRDGGSKIIFFSNKTTIDKSTSGTTSDLSAGQMVTVNGKTNSDGSLAAQNIQIRPTMQN